MRESQKTAGNGRLKCWWGVWSSIQDPPADLRPLLVEERAGHCFFYPYRSGMVCEAAAELQERQRQEVQRAHDRLVRILCALLGAVAGAAVTAAVTAILR